MLTFPELSRKPSLKTKRTTLDPTLRDEFENGAEATTAQYTRFRRESNWTIEHLTPADVDKLDDFVEKQAVGGANEFIFADERDPHNPRSLVVKFEKLPSYEDEGWIEDSFRQKCTFTLRTV